MASTDSVAGLDKRATCYSYGYGYYSCRSRWYDWGRWVVLAGVVVFIVLIMMAFVCTARRRRRRGVQPMYGTGWMAPPGKYNEQHPMNNYQQGNYNGEQYNNQGYNAPPAYGQQPQNTGATFNPHDGYYGQQQHGVQQPQNAYQPDGNYVPPAGPPPGK